MGWRSSSVGLQRGSAPVQEVPCPSPRLRGLRGAWAWQCHHVLAGKRAFPKLEEKVGQLESACRMKGRLKAGSEMNLLAIGTSLKGHIAATSGSAGSEVGALGRAGDAGSRGGRGRHCPLSIPLFQQGSFLTPLLKRTASARSALRPSPPSPLMVERGNVLQKRKVPAGRSGRAELG